MTGYYGHWPRIRFGMNPAEGGFDDGRSALVEPALVTTLLCASADGTIEHQAEFQENDPGQVAAKLYAGRVSSFSSAIASLQPEFFDFDYLLEPNYSTNRSYTPDDVNDMTPDDIGAAIHEEHLRGVHGLRLETLTVVLSAVAGRHGGDAEVDDLGELSLRLQWRGAAQAVQPSIMRTEPGGAWPSSKAH